MKTITKFLKVTLVGGLLVVLPLWVSLLLLLKAIKGALAMLLPIAKLLPQAVVHEKVVALGLLLVICFVVGLIIRTQPGEASRPLDRRTHTWSYSRVFAYARYDPTIGWGQGRAVIPTGTGGDRGRIGAGIHHRETYGRTAHGIRLVQPNADGRRHLYSFTRTGASGGCAPAQGYCLRYEMGCWGGRDACGDPTWQDLAQEFPNE